MPEDILSSLDEAFAKPRTKTGHSSAVVVSFAPGGPDTREVERAHVRVGAPPLYEQWPWLEIYLAVQFLWGALLFMPGAQDYRALVRALPYVTSLALLAIYFPAAPRAGYPPGARWLLAALALLAANLLHPTTQSYAGIAQWIFQLAIAAPMFWARKAIRSTDQVWRVLMLVLLLNGASAGVGILQVYFPERFMPPQFNSLGVQLNDLYVESLSYIGRGGQKIIRPPGLTDQPGGAAVAGSLAALVGLGLSLRSRSLVRRVATSVVVAVGLTVTYLTQIRSTLLMVIGAAAALVLLLFRQRRFAGAAWIAGVGGALVVAGFVWASSVGGESVERRFLDIGEQGAVRTYQENRGHFLSYTLGELLDQYPLGAGIGRWGMMSTYFGDPTDLKAPPIYVEIQLTGWLLDGGFPMWILYGGAIALSLLNALRLTKRGDPELGHAAALLFAVQILIAGMAWAGPVFNTQLGMLFWTCAAVLHGMAAIRATDSPARPWSPS